MKMDHHDFFAGLAVAFGPAKLAYEMLGRASVDLEDTILKGTKLNSEAVLQMVSTSKDNLWRALSLLEAQKSFILNGERGVPRPTREDWINAGQVFNSEPWQNVVLTLMHGGTMCLLDHFMEILQASLVYTERIEKEILEKVGDGKRKGSAVEIKRVAEHFHRCVRFSGRLSRTARKAARAASRTTSKAA
ncbi:MAG: hypothetical protein HY432_02515 [Candidatus Liptonbacteria bacterium]|nr:hypothetical protein [Candidatus Liptonbacteria bacterium]